MSLVIGRVRELGRRYPARRALWVQGAVLLILLLAYLLRTSTLTLQSMWIDEIMVFRFTRGDLMETIRTIVRPEHNGPLFYLVFFGWRRLVGDSDFATRYLSVSASILTMALLYQWAKRLLSERTALVSIWFLAVSPFVLWYAQEIKMYSLHMLTAVASSVALLSAFRRGGWYRWLTYTLLVSTVLYSHFFGAFLIASQVLVALVLGWRRWKRFLAYVAAMVALAAVHLPLARFALMILSGYQPQDVWRGFIPLDEIARDMVSYYFYRVPFAGLPSWKFMVPVALLAAGAALLLVRRREGAIVLLQAFMPVLIFYPVSFRVPVYDAKYLCAVLPALFVVVGWAGEALSRLWRPLGAVILVIGMLMLGSVVRDLTDPSFQRGDWRFVADYVADHEGPNDEVLVFAHYVTRAFDRYYEGSSFVRPFAEDPYDPWPFYQRQAESYDRLWLVLNHDQAMAPENQLRQVAGVAFPVITEQYPNMGSIALVGYQMRYAYPQLPAAATPLEACFENGICLAGYQLDATSLPATDRLSHPPSNWIHAVLYWRVGGEVSDLQFRPLVRVVDDSFGVWGGNLDRRPDLFDRYPALDWQPGEVIETHFDLNLNPITPSGMYRLELSLAIDGDDGNRVALTDALPDQPADRLVFESIQIETER